MKPKFNVGDKVYRIFESESLRGVTCFSVYGIYTVVEILPMNKYELLEVGKFQDIPEHQLFLADELDQKLKEWVNKKSN